MGRDVLIKIKMPKPYRQKYRFSHAEWSPGVYILNEMVR